MPPVSKATHGAPQASASNRCIGQVVLQRRQYEGITGRIKQAQANAVSQRSHLMQRHINTYRFFAFRPKDDHFHTAVVGDMSQRFLQVHKALASIRRPANGAKQNQLLVLWQVKCAPRFFYSPSGLNSQGSIGLAMTSMCLPCKTVLARAHSASHSLGQTTARGNVRPGPAFLLVNTRADVIVSRMR